MMESAKIDLKIVKISSQMATDWVIDVKVVPTKVRRRVRRRGSASSRRLSSSGSMKTRAKGTTDGVKSGRPISTDESPSDWAWLEMAEVAVFKISSRVIIGSFLQFLHNGRGGQGLRWHWI